MTTWSPPTMDHAARRAALVNLFSHHSIDALLVTNLENVRYLTGFTGDSTYLLLTNHGDATLLTDRRYETQIAEECGELDANIRGPGKLMPALVRETLQPLSDKRLGFEADDLSFAVAKCFQTNNESISWTATSGMTAELRMIKDAGEIEILRRAVWVAQQSFQATTSQLRPGWTERQIAHALEQSMRDLGAKGSGFDAIIAMGANAALPHATPGTQTLDDNPVLLIDWGANLHGYTSDLTRTLHRDGADPQFESAYQAVLDGQMAAIRMMGPGVKLSDVDAAARDVIDSAGYGDAFSHGLGHGIGLQVHESPRMAGTSEGTLQAGMVVTVEPGVYFAGRFGIRIEDDVLITQDGCESLSNLPKTLADSHYQL